MKWERGSVNLLIDLLDRYYDEYSSYPVDEKALHLSNKVSGLASETTQARSLAIQSK